MANQSFQQKIIDWMRGRNGSDELSIVAVGLSFVILLINLFVRAWWMGVIALIPLAYACWRVSSTNIAARRAENHAFLVALGSAGTFLKNPAAAVKEKREYHHFSCPSCGQRVRVPRGKGRIRITCPTCGEKFDAES